MNRKTLLLTLESVLCAALALWLALAAVGLYREGLREQAADPRLPIFTREKVARRLAPMTPLALAVPGVAALGALLGVREENGPVKGGRVEHTAARVGTLRAALLLAACGLLAAGIYNGGARDVFGKAVRLCTECVGLG